jgi:predicted alpha-1,2-mannosidase
MSDRLINYVDPFIGVDKGGNCLPGPYLPNSMARPGPDCWPLRETNTNGYQSDSRIMRFSQTHVSGTGGDSRYGNIAVTPFTGVPRINVSPYDKKDETAHAGYYSVRLLPADITAEITVTPRTSVYRFNFKEQGNLLIDTGSVVRVYDNPERNLAHSIGGYIERVSSTEIIGRGDLQGGWGHNFPYSVYFCARTDIPFDSSIMAKGDLILNSELVTGPESKTVLHFNEAQTVNLRIGISFSSIGNARRNLDQEAEGKTFDQIRKEAEEIWEKQLSKITISCADENRKKMFYTLFSRLVCMPADLGIDDEFHLWKSGVRHFTDYYCLWDSVRNANSLIGLFDPKLEADMLNCLLDVAEHNGWLPDAWIAGHSSHIQGGSSADILFCESALKGIEGIDYEKALTFMRKNNETESPDPFLYGRYLEHYRDKGYVSDDSPNCASKHIEYTYQDWCIGRLAEFLGKEDIAKQYYESSQKLWNLWRDDLKCIAPKKPDGSWVDPFDPFKPTRADYWYDPYYYEGTAHEWSLCALHGINGLIERHGGIEAFEKHLDRFFEEYLYHWKEMILHTPYLYHYVGRPDKSAQWAHEMLDRYFKPERDGLFGNEDMGSDSAFYMCTSIGLYPLMGQDIYFLSAPLIEKTEILLGDSGNTLTINAPGAGEGKHIVSASINGNNLDRAWIRHEEIADGAVIEFTMGDKPGEWGSKELPKAAL